MVREETWEAFVADSLLYAKVPLADFIFFVSHFYDSCEIYWLHIFFAQIFLIAVSLIMDYRVAIWFSIIFSGQLNFYILIKYIWKYMGDADLNVDWFEYFLLQLYIY